MFSLFGLTSVLLLFLAWRVLGKAYKLFKLYGADLFLVPSVVPTSVGQEGGWCGIRDGSPQSQVIAFLNGITDPGSTSEEKTENPD